MCIQLLGCQDTQNNHPIFQYYPPESTFSEGYVNKIYYHYYPDNPDQNAATQIGYTKYIKIDDSRFKTVLYNAGFQHEGERNFLVKGDTLIVESGYEVQARNPVDTTRLNIIGSIHSIWSGAIGDPYQLKYTFGDREYIYSERQKSAKDTMILNKKAKIIETDWDYLEVANDSIVSKGSTEDYYVQGLGYFGARAKGPEFSRHIELAEQISIEEFEKRANHGEHRVAYIDPKKSISDDSDFELCGHIRNVADYYNSTPDGSYLHGKRAMLDTIHSNLDRSKRFDQSGFLVYRFVVNCEGKTGRFVVEGYDSDYQPQEFEAETVDHLYSILERLEEWRPVVIRDEARDAYFYINFKIENGEIVDILP